VSTAAASAEEESQAVHAIRFQTTTAREHLASLSHDPVASPDDKLALAEEEEEVEMLRERLQSAKVADVAVATCWVAARAITGWD
jgi:hypothetical protein